MPHTRTSVEDGYWQLIGAVTLVNGGGISSCSEVTAGSPSGVYQIKTTEGSLIDLFCDMDTAGGPWTVIQRRTNGDVNFYRNWADYKNGFGDLQGEFWIGNDILHLLTTTARTLRVELVDWDNTRGYAQYSSFQVDNEQRNYKLHLYGFAGTVSTDCMTISAEQPFTTFDRDNDLTQHAPEFNCARIYKGAWWYNQCTGTSLNGLYQKDNGDDPKAMYWCDFPVGRSTAPLKETMMKIR